MINYSGLETEGIEGKGLSGRQPGKSRGRSGGNAGSSGRVFFF